MDFNKYKKLKLNNVNNCLNKEYSSIADEVFAKKFSFVCKDTFNLPKVDNLFIADSWQIQELQDLKCALNKTKSKLSGFEISDWNQHTNQRNKGKDVHFRMRKNIEPELLTQAWCKFHEIISKFPIVSLEQINSSDIQYSSLHLCEAPGAFVTCLNHWLKLHNPNIILKWVAMTLNPYYEGNAVNEMISDDRFIRYTLPNWFFGLDNTGNITNYQNSQALIKMINDKHKISLITADGSINCMNDPGEQEAIVSKLHFYETVTAIQILDQGGSYVLKIFTVFEHQSVCLIYFLCCIFNEVHFYKPVTSKEGNSEVYVICLGFKGRALVSHYFETFNKEYKNYSNKAMFFKSDIPNEFMDQVISCAKFFKERQCDAIESNIQTYMSKKVSKGFINDDKTTSKLVADRFFIEFPTEKLNFNLRLVKSANLKLLKYCPSFSELSNESFSERQNNLFLDPASRLSVIINKLKIFNTLPENYIIKPMKIQSELLIQLAKPYEKINNSRFCSKEISEIYYLIYEIIKDSEKIDIPKKKDILNYIKINSSTNAFVIFDYINNSNNNEIFLHFFEAINNLKYGSHLTLFGYQLLSQFNIGLLQLIRNIFEEIIFEKNELLGCVIILKNYKHDAFVLNQLNELNKYMRADENQIILSIISILEIYDSELFNIASELNPWILKSCAKVILDYQK